jgi:signal transduction histidine kinase
VITPLRDESGDLLGFCKVTRDLTERRKAEQERLELAQSQEAVRLREEFLSIASHELRTPLTALQLQLEALRSMPNLDAKLKSKLDRAARSGDRLADLISMLLDVSRIVTGKVVLEPSRFDLLDAVNDVVDNLVETSRDANCEVTVVGQPGLVGDWDRVRIDQVVMNILTNALKYAAGSPVEIVLAREGNTALLEVRDHGPGLLEADCETIFGRFQRAASMRNYGGLGLGLFVTREIVEAHAGSVTARNLPERGACFSVRLPLADK